MRKLFLFFFLLACTSICLHAQSVAINETSDLAHHSAILDVQSISKGMLLPRMTKEQRELIAGPATGLMVYQTNAGAGLYYYDGSSWQRLSTGLLPENLWTANGSHIFNANSGNVGIGVNNPQAKLEISSVAGSPNLLLSNSSGSQLLLRKNTGTGSFNQMILTSDGLSMDINTSSYVTNPDGSVISSISQVARLGGAYAIEARGPVNAIGEVNNTSRTGNANLTPTAYGVVASNATIYASTGNFTCVWNAVSKRYEITISGESYYYQNYITCITPAGGSISRFKTDSSGGKLLVYMYDTAGALAQGNFHFITYKP